jgi:hypothetical protein
MKRALQTDPNRVSVSTVHSLPDRPASMNDVPKICADKSTSHAAPVATASASENQVSRFADRHNCENLAGEFPAGGRATSVMKQTVPHTTTEAAKCRPRMMIRGSVIARYLGAFAR